MSFVDQEDMLQLNEGMVKRIWKETLNYDVKEIKRMTYFDAMNTYGSDKPDLRNPLVLKDVGALVGGHGFKVFDDVISRGGSA
jgi:aspartyl-tRNA synthetase